MQNKTAPIVIMDKSTKSNDLKFSNAELLKINKIFSHRQRYYKNKNKLIYIYKNNSLSFDLDTQNVMLNNMGKEVNIKKMPVTNEILTRLISDMKSLIQDANNKKQNKKL